MQVGGRTRGQDVAAGEYVRHWARSIREVRRLDFALRAELQSGPRPGRDLDPGRAGCEKNSLPRAPGSPSCWQQTRSFSTLLGVRQAGVKR